MRSPLIAALLLLPANRADAQDWEARFPKHPACAALTSRTTRPDEASLVVSLVIFNTDSVISYSRVRAVKLGTTDTIVPVARDSSGVWAFAALPPGSYVVRSLAIGYAFRVDTVAVTSQGIRITLSMEEITAALNNTHNCRPRKFRRPGESACLTSGDDAEWVRSYALDLSTERPGDFALPTVDSANVTLVTDEKTCERAAKLYGDPGDPPRRVVVVRMGRNFMVYDPGEPQRGGEWTVYVIFDSRWKVLHRLLS